MTRPVDQDQMHHNCRTAVVQWWAGREARASARPPAPPRVPREVPRFVPGNRDNVKRCDWHGVTYWAMLVPYDDERVEWVVGRMVGDRMRVWARTENLDLVLPVIARS